MGGSAGSRAMEAEKNYVIAHQNHAQGNLDSAKAYYLRALAIEPDHSGCLMGLGLMAFGQKLLDEAEDLLRRAAANDVGDPGILSNLAAVLLEKGAFAACVEACDTALEGDPRNYEALCNLSFAKRRLDDVPAAIAAARAAIAVDATRANGHIALGTALLEIKDRRPADTDEALAALSRARTIDPGQRSVDVNLAELLLDRGQFRDVIAMLTDNCAIASDDPSFNNLMARAHFAAQDYPSALKFARRHVEVEPDSGDAYSALSAVLINMKQFDEALAASRTALKLNSSLSTLRLDICQLRQLLCEWNGLEEDQREAVRLMLETEEFAGPFHLISMPDPAGSAANQLVCADIFQKRLRLSAGLAPQAPGRRHRRSRLNEKLRIGYLSNDYRDHATASLMSELIERHDRSRFEIVGYCYSHDDGSAFRQRLQLAFDRFVAVGELSVEETARRIDQDGIDILVDLKGFTQGSRSGVLTHRPAPIQVNYLGYPGTMGGSDVDYIIGDPFVTPMAFARFYSEKIVQLPHCYQPNDTQRLIDPFLTRREDHGLPADGFVFCSFNNVNKLTRDVFQIWMRLLAEVPGSVLWLLTASPTVKANLAREAKARGIDPERLVFAPMVSIPMHIARMRMADLFLDSFPCTAHTTASEALWAGLPLLTCAGESFASRVAGSILTAAGVPELIADDLKAYEERALELVRRPHVLGALRDKLAGAAASPLFDIASYTRDIERAYLNMADIYNDGRAPEAFAVRDLPEFATNAATKVAATHATKEQAMQTQLKAPEYLIGFDETEQTGTMAEARVKFGFCPLCYSKDTASIGQSDCSRHALYKPQLPPTISWCLCRSCRHVYADGFFGAEAYEMLYPKTPPSELAGHDMERQRMHSAKIVQRIAKIAEPGIWLDVGFGNGSLLFTADEWGYRAVGLDIRADNVKAMRDLGVDAQELCIEQYEGRETCSVVSMTNLLQYVPFPGSAIENAARLLKPKGLLFLILPNMDTVTWRMMDKQRVNAFWTDIETYHHFTRKRLYELLVQNELAPIEYNVSDRFRSSMEVLAMKLPTGG